MGRCCGILRAATGRGVRGQAPGLAPLAGAICRLHAVAAGGAGQRERGGKRDLAPAWVLARSSWRACRSRSICRATVRGLRCRATAAAAWACCCRRGAARRASGACARGGSEPVHGAAGWLGGLLTPAWGGQRHRDRQPDCGAHRQRAGRSGRVLREHAGAAHGHVRAIRACAALIGRVRGGNLSGLRPSELPFERLVEVLNPARSLSRHPLFQVMLAFQNNAAARFEVAGLAARFEPVAVGQAKFDLSVSVSERRGADGAPAGIVGEIEYASDLFERGDALRGWRGGWCGCWRVRLRIRIVRSGGWNCLAAEERESILAGWNATAHAVLRGELAGAVCGAGGQAAGCDGGGVRARGGSAMASLIGASNQLAHHLRGLGVGPETVVGLCLERSLELIVGLLGILKAGGAYLPLDPHYPAGAACLHAGGCARARAGHAGRVAGSPGSCQRQLAARGGAARCRCGRHRRAAARALRRSRSTRTTPPTSSTPQAQPERRRAWWSSMRASPTRSWAWERASMWARLSFGAAHFVRLRCFHRADHAAAGLGWCGHRV